MLGVVFVLATPVHFVTQTLLADEFSAPAMAAIVCVAAFVLVTLMSGVPKVEELRELSLGDIVLLAVAGVLGVFGTQYLVLAHRFTDAPPGSEVIFFTTAAWGAIAVLAGFASRSRSLRPEVIQVIAAALALAAAAGILANWERPSSFSPFVRYPREHVAMLLSGVGWAAFGLVVGRLSERMRWRVVLPLSLAPSAIVAVVVAFASGTTVGAFDRIEALWPLLVVLCAAFTAMLVPWAMLSRLVGVARAGSLLLVAPVSITVLAVFERRAGAAGPSPVLWDAVAWASAALLVSAVGVAILHRLWVAARVEYAGAGGSSQEPVGPAHRTVARLPLLGAAVLSALAVAAGVLALATPALSARVAGTRLGNQTYEVTWTLPGAETVGPWLAFLAALALLVGSVALVRSRWRSRAGLALAAGALVALLAAPALATTPLRTWTRWIPAEVQQDYGTEYASLAFTGEPQTSLTATLVAGGLAGGLLLLGSAIALIGNRNVPTSQSGTVVADGGAMPPLDAEPTE